MAKGHPDQLKLGIEWLPATSVQQWRLLRSKADALGVTKARKDYDAAKGKADMAKRNYDTAVDAKARGGIADLVGLKNQMDIANTNLEKADLAVKDVEKAYKTPRWTDKFDPVIPEPIQK